MEVVIAGGGVAGLATALAVADDGHRVIVLERGGPPPPGPPMRAGATWHRPTAPQTRHANTITPLAVATLRAHAPALLAALLDSGASLVDMTRAMPPGPPEPDDGELVSLACRRATFDVVLHRYAATHPGVEIRYHTRVVGLLSDGARVVGVRVDRGAVVPADLVVDATGWRALGRRWLAELGVEPPADLSGPVSTTVYCRFYRRRGPMGFLNRGNAAGVLADHYAGVLHPGDNDTFSVALGTLAGDAELRGLRDPGAFDAAARATPWVAQWMDDAMPITDVRVTTSPANILRAMGTTPGFTGPLPVGDAACTTDPMYGRGVGLALAHGFRLAALLRSCAPGELGDAAAGMAADLFLPWFQQARVETQDRVERWRAAVAGVAGPSRPVSALRAAGAAATLDPQVWRGLVRVLMGLRTPDTLTDEPFARRVRDVLASGTPAAPPGLPGRAELVAIVREGAGAGEGRERDHARRGAR